MMGGDNDGGVDGFNGGDGGGGGASGSAGDVVVLMSFCWSALIAEKGEDVVMEEVASCLARWAGAGDQLGARPAVDVDKIERKRAMSNARKIRWKAKMTDDERNAFNAKQSNSRGRKPRLQYQHDP